MKVVHISTEDYGGAGQCCLRIHKSLIDSGIESKVVVLDKTKSTPEVYQYGALNVKFHNAISKFLRFCGVEVTYRNKILSLIKSYNTTYSLPVSTVDLSKCKWVQWADVVHLHWVANYLDIPSFFKNIKKPVVWTFHDESFFYGIAHYSNQVLKNNYLENRFAEIKRNSLRNVDKLCLVMLSNYYYVKFKDNELLNKHLVKVINNPVDTNVFFPIPYLEARKKYNIAPDDIVFAFTAMDISDKRKGLLVLSDVLYSINPNIKILAIGSNPNNICRPNLISIGKLGSPREIREVLSASNYFALPSLQEAFAQSPMEAMACGLPVVAFPVSGTSELINNTNGVICDSFTEDSLKKGINTLMARDYDGLKIRQDMINRFSQKIIANKYIDIYQQLLIHD